MNKHYSVKITYETGRKMGQSITIDGIDPDDIMEILGEITQEQLANANVQILMGDEVFDYFDFLFKHYQSDIAFGVKFTN